MGLLAGSCPTLTLQRQQDIGLRVLTETAEQVGLGGLTISRKESICLLLTWDILENRESVERGQSSDRERGVVRTRTGRLGVHYSPPRPCLCSKSTPP